MEVCGTDFWFDAQSSLVNVFLEDDEFCSVKVSSDIYNQMYIKTKKIKKAIFIYYIIF